MIGSTGYRFASYSPVTSPAKTALCTDNTPQGICQANISDPLVDVVPPAGIFSYAKTSPSTGIYVSSIIRQQGFSFGDTITLSPDWIVRLAASQDWTWTDSYTDTAATNIVRTRIPGGYANQGVSPSASVMFKPRGDMTLYATFANSIQAPDVAAANSGSTDHRQCQPGAPALPQQGRRNRLQVKSAQDQFLNRLVPDWIGRLRTI